MKQNFTKQLVMLAIVFLASMGKAFGYNITTTFPKAYSSIWYEDFLRGWSYWISPGETRSFDNPVRLHVNTSKNPSNQLYRLKKITVDGVDVTEVYNRNNYYEINNETDHTVNIEFEKYGESKRITVDTKNFTYEVQDGNGTYFATRARLQFYDPKYPNDIYYTWDSPNDFLLNSTVRMQVVCETGWQVTKLLVDGTDVKAEYLSNGYHEFAHLDADHKVSVEFAQAAVRTIEVTRNLGEYRLNNWWYQENTSVQFNEGSTVVLSFPQNWFDEDKKYKPTLTITSKGKDPVQVPLDDLVINNYWYEYTIQNLSENVVAKIDWVEAEQNTITVNSDNEFNFSLNDEWPGVGNPASFDRGSDVTFRMRYIQEGLVLKSIKIGDDDITGTFNGTYTIKNLTEDQVINVTFSPAEETYWLRVSFENDAPGTIYVKDSYTDKMQDTGRRFAKGSDVTIFIKPVMGYEVSSIGIEEVDPITYERTYKTVKVTYNETTKEYEYEIPDFQCEQYLKISTQKKASVGAEEVSLTLDASGITTFCSEYDLDFSEVSGIRAFVASGYNAETQKLMLTEVTEVQSGTGLLIMGEPGTYQIPVKPTSLCYQNYLQVVSEDTYVYYSSWQNSYEANNYMLSTDGPYFNRANYTFIPAYRAYLSLPRYMTQSAETVSLEAKIIGDLNGDGKVNVADNVKLADIILNQK